MPNRLAFLGPAGTHSEQACLVYNPEATRLPYSEIPAVASAVDSEEADEGIVPIENSLEGAVTGTVDLLIHDSGLFIRQEIVLPIKHFLVARDGTSTRQIQTIYSHTQALAQCQGWLSKNLPDAELVASLSTSAAVEEMMQIGGDTAAISTERASHLYGASVLVGGIEDSPNNMTRFVVLAPSDHAPTGKDKTSMCFSFDEDAPGILYEALGEFATRGINLTKIESRPTKQDLGRYVFLVDLEGHREDAKVKAALEGVERKVLMFKIFGSFPRYAVPR